MVSRDIKTIIGFIGADVEIALSDDFEEIKKALEAGNTYTFEDSSRMLGYKVTYHITIKKEQEE